MSNCPWQGLISPALNANAGPARLLPPSLLTIASLAMSVLLSVLPAPVLASPLLRARLSLTTATAAGSSFVFTAPVLLLVEAFVAAAARLLLMTVFPMII